MKNKTWNLKLQSLTWLAVGIASWEVGANPSGNRSARRQSWENLMPTAVKVSRMTVAEKLRTMEELWDELCREAGDSLAPPAWHRKVLEQREKALREGKDKPVEWETAKKRIRKATS